MYREWNKAEGETRRSGERVGVMPAGAEGVSDRGEGARQQWSWAGRAFHGFELILGVEK